MDIEAKRQAVYSALYQYSAEAVPLRERALVRSVLGALVGSSEARPIQIKGVQKNLSSGCSVMHLRPEIIQDTIRNLMETGLVAMTSHKKRNAYYLTEAGEEKTSQWAGTSDALFDEAISVLFRDTGSFISKDEIKTVFSRFSFECFALYGRQIAKSVTGTITREELGKRISPRVAFEAAVSGVQLTREQRESLEVRCQRFLRSTEPVLEKLKFHLSNGYYVTQLLGLENAGFNPLAEEAFNGAVFYLDTNVLLLGVFRDHEDAGEFLEMVKLAKRIGVEVRVTRATIDELRKVIADRKDQLSKIVGIIPEDLIEKSCDQVLRAFSSAQDANPELTVDEFFSVIDKIEGRIEDDWGFVFDERDAVQIIGNSDIKAIEAVMDDEAKNTRGWGKTDCVLEHDVAHYLLVNQQRERGEKAWFLTRDRTLEAVCRRIDNEGLPFIFMHDGFLQSISPFASTEQEQMSLADIMSSMISDQIGSFESLFDIHELALMAEYHEDVMATPPDQLVMAFDYIKHNTLQGAHYRKSDIPRVSLELRKFLAADKEQQIRALQDDQHRLLEEVKRASARGDHLEKLRGEEREQLTGEIQGLQTKLETALSALSDLQQESESRKQRQKHVRLGGWITVAFLSFAGLFWKASFLMWFAQQFPIEGLNARALERITGILLLCFVALSVFEVFRAAKYTKKTGVFAAAICVAIGIIVFDAIADNEYGIYADLLAIIGVIATIPVALLKTGSESNSY